MGKQISELFVKSSSHFPDLATKLIIQKSNPKRSENAISGKDNLSGN